MNLSNRLKEALNTVQSHVLVQLVLVPSIILAAVVAVAWVGWVASDWLRVRPALEAKTGCTNDLNEMRSHRARLSDQISGWKFAEPLFGKLPSDIDFLVRDLRVDKKAGAVMEFAGPKPGDEYSITLSKLQNTSAQVRDPEYSVRFALSGVVDTNMVSGSAPLIPMAEGTLAGPINAGNYEFYVSVEQIEVDFVRLAIARRRTFGKKSTISFTRSVLHPQTVDIDMPRPAPILKEAGE